VDAGLHAEIHGELRNCFVVWRIEDANEVVAAEYAVETKDLHALDTDRSLGFEQELVVLKRFGAPLGGEGEKLDVCGQGSLLGVGRWVR
jgi:hypothetical protein